MDRFLTMNRELWNEWTVIHENSAFYDLASFREGGVRLADYEIGDIGEVAGRTLLHLQCHFGIDTPSFARLGAYITGADFSPRAVALAGRLARELSLDARFVESDLYSLPDRLDERFDIVYTSRGVLGWLPDIERWGQIVAHFLKPGGIFYITECHPVAWAMADDLPVRPGYAYWERPEPITTPVAGSYADHDAAVATSLEHSWNHSMSEVIQSLLDAGLRIELFREYPWCDFDPGFCVQRDDGRWYLPDDVEGEIPLFYALRARRPD
ncbi:MAG: methyltransferase, partial [Actinomycetota bacterium]